MKTVLLFFVLNLPLFSQFGISFENSGINNNQIIISSIEVNDYEISSNKNFATNYGYGLDISGISIFYYFTSGDDEIKIVKTTDELFSILNISVYQVSEISLDTLIFTGWKNSEIEYQSKFIDIKNWKTLELNFYDIDSLIISLGDFGVETISDFNFDNIVFDKYGGDYKPSVIKLKYLE